MHLWIAIGWSAVCGDLPTVDLELAPTPTEWPSYLGRCLDVGSPTETLLDRARRCAREEPEDPAHVELIGWLGHADDIPLLEAFALRQDSPEAIDALERLGADRSVLRRIACHGASSTAARRALSHAPRLDELFLYPEALDEEGARALGAMSLPETRTLLAHLPGQVAAAGLWADPSPHAFALLTERLGTVDEARAVLRAAPPDQPALPGIVAQLAHSPRTDLRALVAEWAHTLPDSHTLLLTALADPVPRVRATAARTVLHRPEHPDLVAQVEATDDPWLRPAPRPVPARRASQEPPRDRHRLITPSLPDGPPPTFSRRRVPVSDAEALLVSARAAIDAQAGDLGGALAVLPWLGDDRDIPRLLAHHGQPAVALAALGTDAALDALSLQRGNFTHLWAWSRTSRGWDHAVADPLDRRPEGALRPEGVLSWDAHPTPITRTHPSRRDDLAEARALLDDPEGRLTLAGHVGHRWELVAALPDLSGAERKAALDALATRWTPGEPPPPEVLAHLAPNHVAWPRLALAAGDPWPLIASMREGRNLPFAMELVTPPRAVEDALWSIFERTDRLDREVPHFHPSLASALHERLLAGGNAFASTCTLLSASAGPFADPWLIEALRTCDAPPALDLLPEGQAERVQRALLEPGARPRAIRNAVALGVGGPELLRPWLDDEDPVVRGAVLRHLERTGLPEGLRGETSVDPAAP